MERQEAFALVKENVKNKNLIKHMLAVEAVMGELAGHLGEDTPLWSLVGLLHDIDYDFTYKSPEEHGLVGARMLEEKGFPKEVVDAVKAHNPYHGLPRESLLSRALYAADPVTGLIVAAALVHPQKKLSALDVDFLLNRFKEKQFAKGANREQIKSCEELGLSLSEFLSLSLHAMQKISQELGL
jgi:uncharacterized protein